MFNIHPKGVIPLAGCAIERFDDAGKPGFKITHSSFKTGNLVMAARNPEERDNWIAILKECSKITWNNAQLGAAQIKQLEENTARISQEKGEYIKKLQEEAEARKNEAGKKEELERLAKQLEEEKLTMENIANQFKEEKEMTNQELLDAMDAMRKVEEERRDADNKQQEMHENLLRVEEEKKRQEDLLKLQQEEAEKLAATSDALKSHLETAEENAKRLEDEKLLTERQLEENAKKAQVAEEEKKKLQRTATQAQLNLEEVAASREQTQKELELTSTTLEMEKRERQKLEKRLRLAEDSLKRLDGALRDSGLKVSLEIEADVTTLKSFFEDAAAEAEIQAKKHLLMEEAVRAKKNYERAVYRKNEDMFQARGKLNKVDVDPRLLGESQSTIPSPSISPDLVTQPGEVVTSPETPATVPEEVPDTAPEAMPEGGPAAKPEEAMPEEIAPTSTEENEIRAQDEKEVLEPEEKEVPVPAEDLSSGVEEEMVSVEVTTEISDGDAQEEPETSEIAAGEDKTEDLILETVVQVEYSTEAAPLELGEVAPVTEAPAKEEMIEKRVSSELIITENGASVVSESEVMVMLNGGPEKEDQEPVTPPVDRTIEEGS